MKTELCNACLGLGTIYNDVCPICKGYSYVDWIEQILGKNTKYEYKHMEQRILQKLDSILHYIRSYGLNTDINESIIKSYILKEITELHLKNLEVDVYKNTYDDSFEIRIEYTVYDDNKRYGIGLIWQIH